MHVYKYIYIYIYIFVYLYNYVSCISQTIGYGYHEQYNIKLYVSL